MTPKKLRLPAILLTLAAVSPLANFPEVPAAAAAPTPKVVPEALAEAAPSAEQAVSSATTAFAHGVPGLSPRVLSMALSAVSSARARGISGRDDLLTVIDYSLPSTEPRLWVVDLQRGKVLFHELVAHGSGSGENYATRFSNEMNSRQTSLGLFLTGGTYEGGNGYSLRLKGLDKGLNDLAESRAIVMHGAWYVSPAVIHSQGRLGRSWGCPALAEKVAPEVIDAIKGGTFLFSYAAKAAGSLQKYAG